MFRLILSGLLLGWSGAVQAGEVAGRMRLLARSLQADFSAKRPGTADVPLAIFEFACSDALAKQRVGSAVAELLKREFVGAAPFRLVERSELDRILKEQAIQQTGLTDANSGVQLGKLVGAKAIVTGSVDKLGSSYQVSARLSDVETGDLLAVALQELPARAFEEEARPLLTLVPETQAIGFFIGIGMTGPGALRYGRMTVDPAVPAYLDVTFHEFKPIYAGGGLRYQPVRWLMIEAALTPINARETIKTKLSSPASGSPDAGATGGDVTGLSLDLTAHWIRPLTRAVRALAGAGASVISLDKQVGEQARIPAGSGEVSAQVITGERRMFVRPVLEAGLEWKVQPRLGWSVRGVVYPLPATATLAVIWPGRPGGGDDRGTFGEVDLPRAAALTSIALYF